MYEPNPVTMTFERDAVYTAMRYLRNLSTGRAPLDGTELSEETVLDPKVERSLGLAADLLDAYLENGGFNRVLPSQKRPFEITQEQREAIAISKTPVGVQSLANRISEVLPYDMQRVSYTHLSRWLEYIGALEMKPQEDGTKKRLATALGEELGIRTRERTGPRGLYLKNEYDEHAQQFIIDNLDSIMHYSGKAPMQWNTAASDETEATPE